MKKGGDDDAMDVGEREEKRERQGANGAAETEEDVEGQPPAKVAKTSSGGGGGGGGGGGVNEREEEKEEAEEEEEGDKGGKEGGNASIDGSGDKEKEKELSGEGSGGGGGGGEGDDPDPDVAAPRRSLRPRKPSSSVREMEEPQKTAKETKSAKEKKENAKKDKAEKENAPAILHYSPLSSLKLPDSGEVQVTIDRRYLSSQNRQVRSRGLWGTEVYTQDSDLVAALIHMGYLNLYLIDTVASELHMLKVGLTILPAQTSYASANSNNIRSRSWNSFDPEEKRCSYSIKTCVATLVSGEDIKMFPAPEAFAIISPTFVPAATERVVNTRSSAASTDRKNRFKQEVTLQYNLCNEPWLKYVMASVSDQGLQPSKWTSARLHNEVIYAESQTSRYELSMHQEGQATDGSDGGSGGRAAAAETNGGEGDAGLQDKDKDLFRWSKCESICTLSEMRKMGIPSPQGDVKVLEDAVEWEQFKWGPNGVHIHDTFYPLSRIHFMQRQAPSEA